MNKFHNKGVTFFEIVIAVAIFAILMCPIVAKLIEAMKISDSAKVAQNKYELAENLIENVKNSSDFMPEQTVIGTSTKYTLTKAKTNSFLKDITDGDITQWPNNGASDNYDIHVDTYKYQGQASDENNNLLTNEDGSPKMETKDSKIPYSDYVLTGKAKVGNKKKDCYYAISVSNEEYAKLQQENKIVNNPNNSALATIESLDANKVALINGTLGNYDSTVTSAFTSQKLDMLKVGDRNRWEQYTKQQAEIVAFPNDTVTRTIMISIKSDTGDKAKGKRKYTVTCKLSYTENTDIKLKDGIYAGHDLKEYLKPIEYVVYEKTFTGKLPHIYLMYNPCLYNGNYMENDYIVLDTSEMDPDKSESKQNKKESECKSNVELYVVETAEERSDTAAEAYAEAYKEVTGKEVDAAATKYLYNNKTFRDRSDVTVNIFGASSVNANTMEYVTIYNNFNINPENSMNLPSAYNKYSEVPAGEKTTLVNEYEIAKNEKNRKNDKVINIGTDVSSNIKTSIDSSIYYQLNPAQFRRLENARSAASPLYEVKVYLSDTSFDTSDYDKLKKQLSTMKATISGTKGGN